MTKNATKSIAFKSEAIKCYQLGHLPGCFSGRMSNNWYFFSII